MIRECWKLPPLLEKWVEGGLCEGKGRLAGGYMGGYYKLSYIAGPWRPEKWET